MGVPFDVESGTRPGISVASIDDAGNLVVAGLTTLRGNASVAGTLTVGGQTVTPGAGGSSSSPSALAVGLVAETFDHADDTNNFAASAGTALFGLVYLPACTLTDIGTWISGSAGTTPTTGYNGLALYTEAGVLVDKTNDMSGQFPVSVDSYVHAPYSSGPVTIATPGRYYLGLLMHLTTNARIATAGQNLSRPTINGHLWALFLTGQAAFPASFNPALASTNSASFYIGTG